LNQLIKTYLKYQLKKCHHLWYLTEETAALSFFDDSIPLETKRQMVKALKKKQQKTRLNN